MIEQGLKPLLRTKLYIYLLVLITANLIMNDLEDLTQICETDIAIIGMAGRFPKAKNLDAFWDNLAQGKECISYFTDEDLLAQGVDAKLLENPHYVKAGVVLENVEEFAAGFFDYSPREAEIMDIQQRFFLEVAWEALENAGYNSEAYQGQISIYASSTTNTYVLFNLLPNAELVKLIGLDQIRHNNRLDNLATRVAYKLNLKGSAINVQTGCSSSLVGTHLACQSLLNHESDIALVGGVSISANQKTGYLYQEGGILSPDGHCRAFDSQAKGTISGNGVGVVVLKRLQDAITDGDCIHAVIKGSAINNDGSLKVGYAAPSIEGQSKVITEALAISGVDPETVHYIETHGTGTVLGDPIEIAALTKSFRGSTKKKNFCAIASVKTNIGHLDAAAGIAGLIKSVLALKHGQIPPSLHFQQPNPQIDFADSPFYVNATLSPWPTTGYPRRAGVSSFGVGGTNAHVVLEAAPVIAPTDSGRSLNLLVLSAKTPSALASATTNLVQHLQQHPDLNFADVAYTLSLGRRAFEYRRFVVASDIPEAVQALASENPQRVFTHHQEPDHCPVVLMFSGQGSQYVDMGRELYVTEAVFRQAVDDCCEILQPHLGIDLRDVLYPSTTPSPAQLTQTAIAQPALFVIEYALAQLWMAWGVRPTAMIGHSIGEYVAATLAGVFALKDALAIVAMRGRLMQQLPPGAMLAVPLSASELQPLLSDEIALAASNAPSLCVVAGSESAIEDLQQKLSYQGLDCRRLHTSHAFHSQMMNPIIPAFTEELSRIKLHPPTIPFVSNVTGEWITTVEATDAHYWAKHLRQTVRFAEGIALLDQQPAQIFLEVGTGRTLSSLVKQNLPAIPKDFILSSLRHPQEQQSDIALLLNSLGKLWLAGVEIDWSSFYTPQRRQRVPLPTYPFEKQRYWIEPPSPVAAVSKAQKAANIADWFYTPVWKQSVQIQAAANEQVTAQKLSWLLFVDENGLGEAIAQNLQQQGQDVVIVQPGEQLRKISDRTYSIHPQRRNDYEGLLKQLRGENYSLDKILHFWGVGDRHPTSTKTEFWERSQALGFQSLLFLAQALGEQGFTDPLQIFVVTSNLYDVNGNENIYPEKATVLGPCKVIPQEYPHITCRNIDVILPELGTRQREELIEQLIGDFTATSTTQTNDLVVAYRGHRWVQTFASLPITAVKPEKTKLRTGGVYLITGGLGKIGLTLAEYLAKTVQAKLVLVSRSAFPDRHEWEKWLTTHDHKDPVSHKIRKLQALEDLGAQVLVKSADVANLAQMQALITQVFDHFGQLHGVIHAAGVVGEKSRSTIQDISLTECQEQFQSKVHGLLVLEKVLSATKLDFCLLLSSLASILGGLGYVAYAAANIFMDTFTHQQKQINTVPWISVNWDAWQLREKAATNTNYTTTLAEFVIMPQEGVEAFERILSTNKVNQIVVSTGNLQARIEQWLQLESLGEKDKQTNITKRLYNHTKTNQDYVAASNDAEATIINIWQNLLGIDQIGIHDNFFELGGNSLISIQVINQLKKALNIQIPVVSLYERPTVSSLAELISKDAQELEQFDQQYSRGKNRRERKMRNQRN